MKYRLRRLLRRSSTAAAISKMECKLDTIREDDRTYDNTTVPDTLELSSTSSGILSDHDDYFFAAGASVVDDAYADVRDQLEALSARDKARFAAGKTTVPGSATAEPPIPWFVAYTAYLAYAVLIVVGHVLDLATRLRQLVLTTRAWNGQQQHASELAPLLKSWEHFYTRRLYSRIQDAFNRPIASNPGAHITVLERQFDDDDVTAHMKLVGRSASSPHTDGGGGNDGPFCQALDGSLARTCLNLGSYNYLGFADDWHETCAKDVMHSLDDLPVSVAGCRGDYGTTKLHAQLEATVAEFLGKDDALCFNMGFNTNATTIPALVGRGDLIVSDEMNHTSIVNGARASGAAIRIFSHNNMTQLEHVLREAIIKGRPRTRRPWHKILIVVEGIYSMEGEYCDLRGVVRLAKKYGAYVYLDEAHSIGAMGATGRGCAEYTGVDTTDIDIMMGTFTKSFGAMGGYIAASREVIAHLRQQCAGSAAHNALSPVVCQQVLSAFQVIMGRDGTSIGKQKLQALRDNSNYFRMRLEEMGLLVLGRYDSPIMPVMLYNPTKIGAFSRECLKRGVAVVVVGFPAVPLLTSRARFCISAGHTRADLDKALQDIDEIADVLKLRYKHSMFG